MHVANHRLVAGPGDSLQFHNTNNVGGGQAPEFLIVHYTAGRTLESAVRTFQDQATPNRVSAHLAIGRDGAIAQVVDFNQVAWHAGVSQWRGREGFNRFSIGFELVNAGLLKRQGGAWTAWYGATIPDAEVTEAAHKNGGPVHGWHTFTEAQIAAALAAGAAVFAAYNLKEVLGHDDIAPGRKTDPGPAFPLASFRARLLGRAEDTAARFAVIAALNIRTGPGTEHPKLPPSPLPAGTAVEVLEEAGAWCRVIVKSGDGNGTIGWAHGSYLRQS